MDIVIDNCCIGSWDDKINPEEAIICFGSLISNPCKVLVNKYDIKSEVEYMSFILPYISKLFKVDKNELRSKWVNDELYYKCFGEDNE